MDLEAVAALAAAGDCSECKRACQEVLASDRIMPDEETVHHEVVEGGKSGKVFSLLCSFLSALFTHHFFGAY